MRTAILLVIISGVLTFAIENEVFEEFVSGNHKFTADVYKDILKNEGGNFIASPFSVETILALTNEGARGVTSTELKKGLSLPDSKEKIRDVFKSFLPEFTTLGDQLKLLTANKIYIKPELKLEQGFYNIATSIYDSEVSSIDFRNKIEASESINIWVENKTNHKIKDLVSPTDIDTDTAVLLINALYFSGRWVNDFKTYQTTKKKFFKSKDNSVEIDTMYQSEFLNYYENPTLNATFLELPYRSNSANISMVIALPNAVDGLPQLEENIELLFNQPFIKALVEVDLPKFTVETNIKFKPILQNLGIKKLFSDDADLGAISSTDSNLFVSNVIQKAFINVTEIGTEAAAATAVFAIPASLPPKPDYSFRADHPFLYFIKYNNIVIFIGRFMTPF